MLGGEARKALVLPVLAFVIAGFAFATGQSESKSAGTAGPVTLKYAFWGDQNEINATNALMKTFMASHPGITVDAVNYGSNNQFMQKINTLAASDSLPDLGYFLETAVLTWGMNNEFVDLTDFYKNQPAKLDVLKFITPDGRIVGVSVANEIQVIWYAKKLFDQAGLPYPPADPAKAWSWNQFVQVAKELTKDAAGKTPNDAGFNPNNVRQFGTWIQQWYMPWVTFAIANGGGFVSPDGKTLLMDNPATIDAIQKMADLINVDHVSPKPGSQQMPTAAATALLSGQVAMVVDGTWDLLTLGVTKEQSGLDFGVGVLPKMKTLATTSVGTPIVVYRTGKHIPQAEELLTYVMNPENSLPLETKGLWLPNEVQWYEKPELISKWVDNPTHPAGFKQAVVDFALHYSHQLPPYYVPSFQKMDQIIGPALNQVWLGQKSAKEVIANEIMPQITPIFNAQ